MQPVTGPSMELSAELTNRDGTGRPFRVSCERTLPGLLSGLERLQGEVSAELSQLVAEERGAAHTPGNGDEKEDDGDDDDDDDDEEEDDSSNVKNGTSATSPPTKRKKSEKK